MNRILLYVLVALLAAAPTLSEAQGMLPDVRGWLGMSEGGGCYQEEPLGIGSPRLYVGYVPNQTVTAGAGGPPLAGLIQSIDHEITYGGLWLEAALPVRLQPDFHLSLSGMWLVPNSASSLENYSAAAGTQTRDWSVTHEWYSLTATGAFSVSGDVKVLGGFRYDKADLRFTGPDPNPAGAPMGLGALTDEADTGVILYIPFVGLEGSYRSSGNGTLNFGIIGFPALIGDVDYNETLGAGPFRASSKGNLKSGYFLEIFTDYSVGFMGAELGVFSKYTAVHGLADVETEIQGIVVPSQTWEYAVDRSLWVVGGTFSVEFGSFL